MRMIAIALGLFVSVGLVIAIQAYVLATLLPGLDPTTHTNLGGVGVGAMVAALLAERFLAPPWVRPIAWLGYVWMGALLIGLFASAAVDLVGVVWPAFDSATQAVVLAATMIGCTAWGIVRALRPTLVEAEITLERWPAELDGYRIVQLSDLHIGPILGRRWLRRVVARANALEGDLVVITGDLIDGVPARVGAQLEPLAELRSPAGVYAITGNHEMFCGAEPWIARYRELGLRVLANQRTWIDGAGAGFELCGTHDRTGRHFGHPEDLDAVLASPGDGRESPVRVLLAHDPLSFRRASELGVDLQLSGHTHGGQIWPLHWPVRWVVRWLAGHYREGGSQLWVSRGTGFWGPPIRLGAPAEITRLTLRSR